ncbi:hypothetical protein BN1723_019519, partial [Verticillium longisporum]
GGPRDLHLQRHGDRADHCSLGR